MACFVVARIDRRASVRIKFQGARCSYAGKGSPSQALRRPRQLKKSSASSSNGFFRLSYRVATPHTLLGLWATISSDHCAVYESPPKTARLCRVDVKKSHIIVKHAQGHSPARLMDAVGQLLLCQACRASRRSHHRATSACKVGALRRQVSPALRQSAASISLVNRKAAQPSSLVCQVAAKALACLGASHRAG